jgi:hypothetical protein
MTGIYLTDDEKKALLNIVLGYSSIPSGMGEDTYSDCVSELEGKGLVHAMWAEGHRVVDARPTSKGRSYVHSNPTMRNPINWAMVGAVAAVVTAVIGIIAIFVACAK